jgi:hypothetical protein
MRLFKKEIRRLLIGQNLTCFTWNKADFVESPNEWFDFS